MSRRVIQRLVLAALLPFTFAVHAQDDDPEYRHNQASASKISGLGVEGNERLEFNFGRVNSSAWLTPKGELHVDTWVLHRGFRCATYEVGIRFGHGTNGCADVDWLAPTHWLTSRRQCNNALVNHVASDIDGHIAPLYGRVTCAVRLVRCVSGNCP